MSEPQRKKTPPKSKPKTTVKRTPTHAKTTVRAQPSNTGRAHGFPWLTLFAVIFLVLLGLVIRQSLFRPLAVTATGKMLQVKTGQTYSGLINYMAQHDMVRFPLIIKVYEHLFIHHTLKAGAYELPAGINAYQLLNLLNNGELAEMNRVLLVEGMTFQQLKERLAANDQIKNTVLNLPNAQILAAADIKESNPEGWFAPDTYFFTPGEKDTVILKQLYEKQKRILDTEWQTRATDLPYHSMAEALTMASIVEKETGVDDERAKVAAVFVNRLKQGMRLQTDPTVIYGMGDQYTGTITSKDLETPTAYNTYKIDGLPPTPIAMPGVAAIHAALHPAKINALYFVATGTGGHKFSATLAEHNTAVQQYLQVMRAKKSIS